MFEDNDEMDMEIQPATLALETALLRSDKQQSERKRRRYDSPPRRPHNSATPDQALEKIDFPRIEWDFDSDDSVSGTIPCINLKSALLQSHQQLYNRRRLVRCCSIFKNLSDTHRTSSSSSLTLETTSTAMKSCSFEQSDYEFHRKMNDMKVMDRSLDEILSGLYVDSI